MSLSRRFIRAAVLVSLCLALGLPLGAQEAIDYNARLLEALSGYQEIIRVRLDADVEDPSGQAWYVASHAINEGYLRFTVSPEEVTDLLAGVRFIPPTEETPGYIVFSQALLEAWETAPSLVYTIITGAVRDSYNFFRDPANWTAAGKEPMERLLLKADIYAAQATFVRDRILTGGFSPSPFELFLLDSYETDTLASVTIYLDSLAITVARPFFQMRLAYEDSGDDAAYRQAILRTGEDLLEARDDLPMGAEDKDFFPLATGIHSWLEFTPTMISRIHNRNRTDAPLTFPEILEIEDDYAELRRLLEASRTRDMLRMKHIIDNTRRGFSTQITN